MPASDAAVQDGASEHGGIVKYIRKVTVVRGSSDYVGSAAGPPRGPRSGAA